MDNAFEKIINEYKNFEQVKAVAVGGSSAAKISDEISDIDLYVFVEKDIPVEKREVFTKKYSSKYEVGGEYFGSGDEFYVDDLGKQLDVMFWNTGWFEDVVDNVWFKHYPLNGYTTAFLYTLNHLKILYDKNKWLENMQKSIQTEYPEELRQNIIKRNIMLMCDKPFASYKEQIEKAIKRNDINSVNHRITAFMSSYFDIIFALNKLLHPGEKRLIWYAKEHCKILPDDFEENITELLKQPNDNTMTIIKEIIINLREII